MNTQGSQRKIVLVKLGVESASGMAVLPFGPDWEVVEAVVRFRESPRKVKPPEGKRRQATETVQPRLKIISQDPLS